MNKECEHRFKPYATINYTMPIEDYKDGYHGYFLQDKLSECEICYKHRIITRACKVNTERVPIWFEIIIGNLYEKKADVARIRINRQEDNPEFPIVEFEKLELNGKTVIIEKMLERGV